MNSLFPAFYITPEGNVALPQPLSTFSAPSVNTSTIRVNGTNISVLYQSKADMATYITSGSLTNYVNTSTNQNVAGKKSFTGGINTKSQTVAGATVLGNDILGGVVRVSGSGNINLPTPVDNAGGRISFYFEADCTLQTPSGVFTGTIATGGATLPITIASFGRHLECYSDGTNWIIMRSQATFRQ